MNEFSSLKAAWHIEKIQDLRKGKDVIPTHVQIVMSDLCNQNCHFCAYRMDGGFSSQNFGVDGNKNPVRFIPTEKVKEILDDCAALGVGAIEFTGGGEPTVHKDCFEIIEYAQNLGMETGLVTNGVRLKPHACLEKLTWLRISLDAGNAETYEAMRESKAWPTVIKNIAMVGKLKGPLVGIGFVVTRENHAEILKACQMAKANSIPYVRISAMFSDRGAAYYEGLLNSISWQRQAVKSLEDETFRVIDFFGDRIEDLKKQAPDYDFCGEQQFVTYIGGDQKVYSCCTNAYTTHGEIGNLKNQRFSEWIKNHRRYDFNAKGCHHCQFNDKNKVINYMLSTPKHIDFV